MNVLSLFDGISCGQQALKELKIPAENYYSSEIDKYAISITQKNFPDTIQLGDIEEWREWDKEISTCCHKKILGTYPCFFCTGCNRGHGRDGEDIESISLRWQGIDLIQGGSPCQGFSFAGKQLNFEDPRSKLFFTFVDILNHAKKYNPDVKFLLENVRMKQEYQDVISELLGVRPVMINSSLVSAQNRVRLYWTNIAELQQPEDRGILLKDILEGGDTIKQRPRGKNKGGLHKEKSPTLTYCSFEHNNHVIGAALRGRYNKDGTTSQHLEVNKKEKANSITTVQKDSLLVKLGNVNPSGRGMNGEVYDVTGKAPTVTTNKGEGSKIRDKSYCIDANYHKGANWEQYKKKSRRQLVGNALHWRKLTPIECERLQTLPDNYTQYGSYSEKPNNSNTLISNTQRYKALGNGWTVEVIKHIYRNL